MSREERIDEEILERAKRIAMVLADEGRASLSRSVMAQAAEAVNARRLARLCGAMVKGVGRD